MRSSASQKSVKHNVKARWVEDGKFLTAAGVSAGIEMALYLTAQLKSEEQARLIQAGMDHATSRVFFQLWAGV